VRRTGRGIVKPEERFFGITGDPTLDVLDA